MTYRITKACEGPIRFCFVNIGQGEERDTSEEFESLTKLTNRRDWAMACVCVPEPENSLSPWEGPAVFGDRSFGSGAGETLRIITESILPELSEKLNDPVFIIEGYSFAGLFALWASYNTDAFTAVCGVSPSVWFPGWNGYADKTEQKCRVLYVSIGKSEKKTRNRLMCTVEDDVRRQYERSKAALGEDMCKLEYNEGNHFTDVPLRRAKAMAFCLKTLCKNS